MNLGGETMLEPFVRGNASSLQIETWQQLHPGLKVGFTTRTGGVSTKPYDTLNLGLHVPDFIEHVIENRLRLAEIWDMPIENWVSGEQIHGTNIYVVHQHDKGKGAFSYDTSLAGIDGLITNEKGILCTAFFADCVPLYFFDPTTGYIGIAHAGWKGTANRIAEKMVAKMQMLGVKVGNLCVAIGPSISQEHYEVDNRVIQSIARKDRKHAVKELANGQFLLDLKKVNMEILLQCGIIRNNIKVTNYCTYRDQQLFFSHRRDQGKTGRMLGYIGYSS